MNFDVSKTEPDFTNPEGVKWWRITGRAPNGIWLTELPDGEKNYVGILDGEIVAEGQQLDAVAVRVDMLRFAREAR